MRRHALRNNFMHYESKCVYHTVLDDFECSVHCVVHYTYVGIQSESSRFGTVTGAKPREVKTTAVVRCGLQTDQSTPAEPNLEVNSRVDLKSFKPLRTQNIYMKAR